MGDLLICINNNTPNFIQILVVLRQTFLTHLAMLSVNPTASADYVCV